MAQTKTETVPAARVFRHIRFRRKTPISSAARRSVNNRGLEILKERARPDIGETSRDE